jgi:hypothetical protein
MKETIAKSDWLTAQLCAAMAWHGMRAAAKAPDEAERFRMQQGQEIEALARRLYPDGILIPPVNGRAPHAVTRDLIADRSKEIFLRQRLLQIHSWPRPTFCAARTAGGMSLR